MSDFTSKDHKGLLEAYHSIYNKKEEVVEELNESVEETLTEDYDVNILLENVKDYLVLCGYVDTEDQAYDIMPHMTEEFFGTLIGEMYAIGACINMKEHLISEGCEVEDYTIEDMLNLFENYEKENLNEVAITTAVATSPWWVPAALTAAGAVGTYLTNKDRFDRLGTSIVQKATDAVKGASDFVMQARRAKPARSNAKTPEQVRAEIDAKEAAKKAAKEQRKAAREQGSQTSSSSKARTQNQPSSSETAGKPPSSSSSSSSSSSNTSGNTPEPPKEPKDPGVFSKIGQWTGKKFNDAMKGIDAYNKKKTDPFKTPDFVKNLPPFATAALRNLKTGVTGAKNILLGKTWRGLGTRVGGSGAADQVGLSGAIGTKVNQAIKSGVQKTRAWGEDEKAKDIKQGEREREEFRRRREQQKNPLDPSKYYTGDL